AARARDRARGVGPPALRPTGRRVSGIVYLVGAGPGDPGLLTVRAQELLATCDAIAADALANPDIVAAARAYNPTVELHDVGKRGGSGGSGRREERHPLRDDV